MLAKPRLRRGMLLAVLAGAVCVPAGGAATAADLTVGAFGGIWEQSLTRCTIEPFERATGATVEVVLGQPVQWLNQIAASPDNPPFDIGQRVQFRRARAVGRIYGRARSEH